MMTTFTRRELLGRCGMGMGAVALANVVAQAGLLGTAGATVSHNPLAPRSPQFPSKAKRVLHLFMNGGPSQVDTFDPKPALERYAGKLLPGASHLRTERKTGNAFPSIFKFKKYGKSGIEVSELFEHVGSCADDLCVVRSMHTDFPNHEPSLMLMNTGEARLVRPSVGSWVTYGLGSENQNLPGFVVLCPEGHPVKAAENWQAGFLPGAYQGTYIDTRHTEVEKLVANVRSPVATAAEQRRQLDLLRRLDRRHAEQRGGDALLEARIQSFELAYRMQMEATDAFDVTREPKAILEMYGPGLQARQLLIARRLLEKGVRFVQVWTGRGQPWDNHDNLADDMRRLAGDCDRPIAALLKDLKQRGLLDETLVIWGGEFGRTPTVELPNDANSGKIDGRDHNHWGFSMWLAGGGVKKGHIHGATDELGYQAIEKPVHVRDLHATILHLLGFDHEKLTYRYAGRDFRLTDVEGEVVRGIVM